MLSTPVQSEPGMNIRVRDMHTHLASLTPLPLTWITLANHRAPNAIWLAHTEWRAFKILVAIS